MTVLNVLKTVASAGVLYAVAVIALLGAAVVLTLIDAKSGDAS